MSPRSYSPSQVAAAAGVVRTRVLSWIERDFPRVEPGEAPGPGRKREFSHKRARQLVLAARLIRWGFSAREAGIICLHLSAYEYLPGDTLRVGRAGGGGVTVTIEQRGSLDRRGVYRADSAGNAETDVVTLDLGAFLAVTDSRLDGRKPPPWTSAVPEFQMWSRAVGPTP